MKRIFKVLVFALFATSVFAQSPNKMSYQAVIRNSENKLVVNKQVGMQISILQGSASGSVVYMETHNSTTNSNGLVSVIIGNGSTSYNFSEIDWASSIYFIKTEIDPNGGNNYTITSISQLLSVPYALHSKTAERVTGTINETDPLFLAWSKDYNDLTNKPTLFSGSYNDLQDKPSIFSGSYIDLTNKPTNATKMKDGFMSHTDKKKLDNMKTFSGSYNDLSDKPINATNFTDGFMSSEDKAKLNSLRKTDGSETKIRAGENVTITGKGTVDNPYEVTASGKLSVPRVNQVDRDKLSVTEGMIVYNMTTHKPNYYNGTEWMNYDGSSAKTPKIGDVYHGGEVAYIFKEGDDEHIEGEIHGIIICELKGSSDWNYAKKWCNNLSHGSYTDWFLPNMKELKQIGGYLKSKNKDKWYWSSEEKDDSSAKTYNPVKGQEGSWWKDTNRDIIAIRKF